MPHIENHAVIACTRWKRSTRWRQRCQNSFPQFMPDVESVTVAERSEDGSRSVDGLGGCGLGFQAEGALDRGRFVG